MMTMDSKNERYLNHSILMNDYSLLMNMMPKNTSKIMMFLLRNAFGIGYNINQIANILEISVGSSFKILKELKEQGLVTSQDMSNASYYKLNLNNPQTVNLCEFLLIEQKKSLKSHAKIYGQEIQKFEKAELILLFGSVLRGNNFNDVDALFLTPNSKEVNRFCLEISKVRTKPVVPLIMGKQGLVMEIKQKKDAILDIIRTGIVLRGEKVFVEVMKNAQS